MKELKIPAEHYNELTANQQEDLYSVLDSVQGTIEILTSVKEKIMSGRFSQVEAELTYDDLINNAGIDFLSTMQAYSWSDH